MIRVAVKFGLFVAVCLGFTVYLAFAIGNLSLTDPFGRDTFSLSATFDDVTGLLVNDNVKVAGVPVGKVTGIRTEDGRAVVDFEVRNDHRGLPADTAAGVRWRNLIGQRYLYLYPGDAPTALEDGDTITATESVIDLGELFNDLGPVVGAIEPGQVNDFLDAVTGALEGREGQVGAVIDDLAVLTGGLASRDEAITRLVEDLQVVAETVNRRDAQIEQMLENLVAISRTFGDNTALLDAALVEFGDLSASLDRIVVENREELDRLLTNLALVTDTVVGKLPELDTFLANFGQASEAIFRAGNRGEMLNQKIICPFVAPPASSEAGCPLGDPIVGLGGDAARFSGEPVRGADALRSLVQKAAGG